MEIDAGEEYPAMMEILIFTLNAIFIYLFSDWIIRTIEQSRSEALKHRQVVFFVVFLTLALVSFQILQIIFAGS
jgi:surface polysaccharide O-acyltransferase-like enzyme